MSHDAYESNKETAVLGDVSHTDIHIKNGIVWTAARHRAERQRTWKKSKIIIVGGWLFYVTKNEQQKRKREKRNIKYSYMSLGNTWLALSCVLVCVV